jgi:hypothetical protein
MFYTFQPWQSSTSVLGMSRFSITKVNSLSSSFSTWMMEAESQSLRIFLGRRLRIAWWFTVCHHGFTCLEHPLKTSIISIPNYQQLPGRRIQDSPGLYGPGLFTNTVQEVVFWNWKLNRKPTIGTLTPPTTALWENHDKSSRDQPAIGVYLRMYQGWLKKNSNVQCYSAPNTGGKCPTAQLPWSLGVPSTLKTAPTTSTTPGAAKRFSNHPVGGDHYDTSHQFRWNLWNILKSQRKFIKHWDISMRLPTAKGFYITPGVLIRWDWMFGWKIKPLGLWHAQGGYVFWSLLEMAWVSVSRTVRFMYIDVLGLFHLSDCACCHPATKSISGTDFYNSKGKYPIFDLHIIHRWL